MTAVAALQLAERGRLDLDAPGLAVLRRLPAEALARHAAPAALATRAASAATGPASRRRPRHFFSVARGPRALPRRPARLRAGHLRRSTPPTATACSAAWSRARRAGPFAEVLREEVFAPAGMTRDRAGRPAGAGPPPRGGYVRKRQTGELLNSAFADVSLQGPGRRALRHRARRRALRPRPARGPARRAGATLQQMLTPQRLRTGRVTGFGLGAHASARAGGRREAWHIGGQEQVSTLLYLRPDSGLVVVLLSNLEKVQTPLLDLGRRRVRPPDGRPRRALRRADARARVPELACATVSASRARGHRRTVAIEPTIRRDPCVDTRGSNAVTCLVRQHDCR